MKAQLFDIYDEVTNKTLQIKAHTLEQAEGIADTIPFEDYDDGAEVDVLDDIESYEALPDSGNCGYCGEPYVPYNSPDGERCQNCDGM